MIHLSGSCFSPGGAPPHGASHRSASTHSTTASVGPSRSRCVRWWRRNRRNRPSPVPAARTGGCAAPSCRPAPSRRISASDFAQAAYSSDRARRHGGQDRRCALVLQLGAQQGIATVDAGVVLADLHAAAAEAGRQFPLYLGSEGNAQAGGLISTNAGGVPACCATAPCAILSRGLKMVYPRPCAEQPGSAAERQCRLPAAVLVRRRGRHAGRYHGCCVAAACPDAEHCARLVVAAGPAAAVRMLAALQDRAGSLHLRLRTRFRLAVHAGASAYRKRAHPLRRDPAWSMLVELGSEDGWTRAGCDAEIGAGRGTGGRRCAGCRQARGAASGAKHLSRPRCSTRSRSRACARVSARLPCCATST